MDKEFKLLRDGEVVHGHEAVSLYRAAMAGWLDEHDGFRQLRALQVGELVRDEDGDLWQRTK